MRQKIVQKMPAEKRSASVPCDHKENENSIIQRAISENGMDCIKRCHVRLVRSKKRTEKQLTVVTETPINEIEEKEKDLETELTPVNETPQNEREEEENEKENTISQADKLTAEEEEKQVEEENKGGEDEDTENNEMYHTSLNFQWVPSLRRGSELLLILEENQVYRINTKTKKHFVYKCRKPNCNSRVNVSLDKLTVHRVPNFKDHIHGPQTEYINEAFVRDTVKKACADPLKRLLNPRQIYNEETSR